MSTYFRQVLCDQRARLIEFSLRDITEHPRPQAQAGQMLIRILAARLMDLNYLQTKVIQLKLNFLESLGLK